MESFWLWLAGAGFGLIVGWQFTWIYFKTKVRDLKWEVGDAELENEQLRIEIARLKGEKIILINSKGEKTILPNKPKTIKTSVSIPNKRRVK